jgi:hypothetical protein
VAALDPLKKAAIYAMSLADEGGDVAKAVSKADDWGWKGGNPGELTGGEYLRIMRGAESQPSEWDTVSEEAFRTANKQLEDAKTAGKPVGRLYETMYNGSLDDGFSPGMARIRATSIINRGFADLEKAQIPRSMTGKVLPQMYNDNGLNTFYTSSLLGNIPLWDSTNRLSVMLETMDDAQRENFLALLPEWDGYLDDLAEAARSL